MPEHNLSSLLEFLPIGVYRLTVDGKLLFMNPALVQLQIYPTTQELSPDSWQQVPNPYVEPNRRDAFWSQIREQGWVHNFDSEVFKYTTGQRLWVREHAHIVRDAEGRELYLEGTIENITSEHLARTQLEERESLLQNVLASIPDHIWVKDLNGTYLTCNQTFADQMGCTIAEIVGSTDSAWVTQAQDQYIRDMDQICLESGQRVVMEEAFVSLANPLGDLHEFIKTPMRDAHGSIVGLLGMARNIQERKKAEAFLRDTTEQLELAILGADLARWSHDLTTPKGYYIDEVACHMLGRDTMDAKTGRTWGHLIHPDDLPMTLHAMQAHLDGETPAYRVEYRARHSDGRWIWLFSKGKVVQFAQDGTPQRMVGTLADISVRKQFEDRLRETQSELEATLNALPDLMFEFNVAGQYLSVHTHDPRNLKLPVDELIGRFVGDVLPKDAADACMEALLDAQQHGRSQGVQYPLELPTGKHWFELSIARKPTEPWKDERFIAIVRDITERKNAEQAIQHIAFHDSLTGLPNRRLLTERMQHAFLTGDRSNEFGAVMFLDLDRFKHLNDTFGHDMGDLLLQEVARRLLANIRSVDTAARLGGDEFVVLINDLSTDLKNAQNHAKVVGNKILASLNQPYNLNGMMHVTTPSIGVALYCGNKLHPNDVLKHADAAMYQAKSLGRNNLCFYQEQK